MNEVIAILFALLVFGLLWPLLRFIRGLFDYIFSDPPEGKVHGNPGLPRDMPPTARQMAYIDILCEEREVPTRLLEVEPETVRAASALIDALKECPRR